MNRPDHQPEWYELAIADQQSRLTPVAVATRSIIVGTSLFWLAVGAALWWLL